jgi:hypothetical protein
MITFRRLFAAALLLCAFAGATGGQEKNMPSTVVIEEHIQELRTQFLSSKKDLEQRLDRIEQRLDRIESLIGQLAVSDRKSIPSDNTIDAPKADGKTYYPSTRPDYSDFESCCRHINHHVPCCGHVYHEEPCCRHAYHRESW